MLSSAIEGAVLASKFRGCLAGVLMGDCLGAPFEGEATVAKVILQKYFDKMEDPKFKSPVKMYTDDTAMTKCIAESLIHNGSCNEKDVAKRFITEYFQNSRRCYGGHVVEVFHKLRNSKLEDVWRPAREQFGGSGSYGNGGAMRVSPVALFSYNNYDEMLNIASKCTRITHTNKLGINGALLQCIAVHQSLHHDPKTPIDVKKFSTDLIEKMAKIEEKTASDTVDNEDPTPYQTQLKLVQRLLEKGDVPEYEVIKSLGHSTAALYSVPTAIYCFLRAQSPISYIETDNPFRRVIQYGVSLAGDCDTIASMAGAISGAYHGFEVINAGLQTHCEAFDEVVEIADELYKATT